MELAAEAKMHASNAQRDLKMIWRRVARARPPKWAVALLCVGTFVAGWIGGALRGNEEGWQRAELFHSLINTKVWERAEEGKLAEAQLYMVTGVDRRVREVILDQKPAAFSQWIWKAATVSYWAFPDEPQRQLANVRIAAERRLKLLPPPTAETLALLKSDNREWIVQERLKRLEPVAAQYSELLGRPIKAEQLLSDAEVRLEHAHSMGKYN